jgi:hypothetical protein
MLLSARGIYGVTAYTVTQRTHELGIRIALGAQVSDVLKMILGREWRDWCGTGAWLASAFALMRLLRSLLFGVGENDPLTFAGLRWCCAGGAARLLHPRAPRNEGRSADALRYE